MKKMVRLFCISFLLVSLFSITGCASWMEYMANSTKLQGNGSLTNTQYESSGYQVLGMVTAEGESKCILGLFAMGTEGQALLWKAAKGQFGDRVTGIKDINVNFSYTSISFFWMPIFTEKKSTYVGTAVHEK